MAKVALYVNLVDIATTAAVTLQHAGFFEILHDALDGSLGDADLVGDIAKSHLGVPVQADQHVRMVCEKSPFPRRHLLSRLPWHTHHDTGLQIATPNARS